LTLALTGASGALYGREMLRLLAADERVERVHLVCSESGRRVLADELGVPAREGLVEALLGAPCKKVHLHENTDVGAPIASGSYPCSAMIVLPCSMGTLARIAHGTAENLIERAADVCLKERRPLVLCVRETPFSLIHLRNMTQATEAGSAIFPLIPAFYAGLETPVEMAREFARRVLQYLGLPQPGAYIWKG
jgi:4-hydroxy-3-polyprenylbenzoate decarboxylase